MTDLLEDFNQAMDTMEWSLLISAFAKLSNKLPYAGPIISRWRDPEIGFKLIRSVSVSSQSSEQYAP